MQLCQALRLEATDSGTGPSTVVSQTGELGRFCTWIASAWTELQQEREDWKWMRKSFTCPTVSGTSAYAYSATGLVDTVSLTAVSRFGSWSKKRRDWKAYLTSGGVSGEYFLNLLDWESFKYLYRKGTQTSAQPVHVSIDPTMKFCLGPAPDAVYTVSGDYIIGPQTLALDADEPEMPSRFHRLITYEALSKYGGNRAAPEAMLRALTEGARLRAALELDQLPRFTMGRPMGG